MVDVVTFVVAAGLIPGLDADAAEPLRDAPAREGVVGPEPGMVGRGLPMSDAPNEDVGWNGFNPLNPVI